MRLMDRASQDSRHRHCTSVEKICHKDTEAQRNLKREEDTMSFVVTV